jgi:adenylate cyclase class IV
LELKALLSDPPAARARLLAAGARAGFRGRMSDARYDRDGALQLRDEVLRLREFRDPEGGSRILIAWKGPTGVTAEGHKSRRELEYDIRSGTAAPGDLLAVLGFVPVQVIDRYVEYYHLGDTDVRLEWYPRMDALVEVEGSEAGIDAGIAALGLPRDQFSPEPLRLFVERFVARTGHPAALSLAELQGGRPTWEV